MTMSAPTTASAPRVATLDRATALRLADTEYRRVVEQWRAIPADARHGRPCTLRLTGPAGGSFTFGSGGPAIELDSVELCRALSGRGAMTPPLGTHVPF